MKKKGFTLIETLVALVLFQFGMLAIAAAAAVAARDLAAAQRIVRAQTAARNRVALLIARACPAVASGTEESSEHTEHWRVESLGHHRTVRDSIDFALPRGRRGHVVARGSTLCP